LRVIEISAYVATPLAGMTLAQLGADVIRVEPLGGQVDRDRMPRSPEGTSLYWAGLNQGKRSIAVDFRSSVGRELVAELATAPGAGGGLVISNTTAFEELRWQALSSRRPDSVLVQLTGRRDGRGAVDFTVQASSGLHDLTGHPGRVGPVNNALPFWDVICGQYIAIGLMSALHRRTTSGRGQQVEVALEDVALSTVGYLGFLADAQLNEHPRQRDGNYVFGTLGVDFATADGQRVMAVFLTARHWRQMVELADLVDVISGLEKAWDVDFSGDHARYTHREVLAQLLRPWFRSRTLDQVLTELSQTSILVSEYVTFAGLADDNAARLRANPLFTEIEFAGVRPHLAAGSPLLHNGRYVPASPAPAVGEHTATVLAEILQCDPDRIDSLRRAGVLETRSAC
jgi:2-methylfumaryl-CoA isomerase